MTATSGRVSSRRIDVHTHAMPDDAAGLVAAKGFRPTGGYKVSVRWTPREALAYMDRHGITAQVVSMPMAFAGSAEDPQFGTRVCRMINEGNAELIAKHLGRFGAFASLPADGPDEALTELAYALDELRLDGVVLTSNVAGHYFGDPFLEPLLAELERRLVPVFLHRRRELGLCGGGTHGCEEVTTVPSKKPVVGGMRGPG
jgi:6-methylsalicylate decarboxylase